MKPRGIFAAVLTLGFLGCQDAIDDRARNEQLAEEDGIAVAAQGLPKGSGGTNGDVDFCRDGTCVGGEGDCDSNAECSVGVCGLDNGELWNLPSAMNPNPLLDVCVPAHCTNELLDSSDGEINVDCGGPCSDVAVDCDQVGFCPSLPPDGQEGHCTTECTCPEGEGDCDTDAECESGLFCNQVTGIDSCTATNPVCLSRPANGTGSRCNSTCPCPSGEGDCDGDAECETDSSCQTDQGLLYGFNRNLDMCIADACFDGLLSAGEDDVDCGGTCLPCVGQAIFSLGLGETNREASRDLAIDRDGNIFIVGRFSEDVDFGNGNISSDQSSDTSSDIFIAKFDPGGQHVWSQRFGGSANDGDVTVSVDTLRGGDVVFVGNYQLTADFDGFATSYTSAGDYDSIIARLDGDDGSVVWARSIGSTGRDLARDVSISTTDTIVVAGSYENTVDFGASNILTSAGNTDMFVMSIRASDGSTRFARSFGGTGTDRATAIGIGPRNSVLAGVFQQTVAFDRFRTSIGPNDAIVVELSPTLQVGFVEQLSQAVTSEPIAVAVDDAERATVAGYFSTDLTVGTSTLTSNGKTDAFAINFDSMGGINWSTSFGGSEFDRIQSVAVDRSSGDIVVTGHVEGVVSDFPGGSSSPGPDLGLQDRFVVVWDSAGMHQFSRRDGSTGEDFSVGVDVLTGFGYASTGWFTGTATVAGAMLSSAGDRDVFLTRNGL